MYNLRQLYKFFIQPIQTRLTRVQYIMLIATFTGLLSGLVAVCLKTLVHYLQHWIVGTGVSHLTFLLFPAIGLLLTTVIIRYFFNAHIEKGIAMVLRAIARRSSFIPMKHTYLHVITSSLTVGLGGSAGLEAPIVATGSAVGSNTARISDLNYRERTLLIGCGAAAGIAAVFNAPIAGVIFAIEVLLTEAVVVSYFIPLIISSVIGALCSKIILQESFLFNFILKENFNYRNVPYYLLLGVLAGVVARYYAQTFKGAEGRIHAWKINAFAKAITGGLLLMAIYLLFPPLFGEGYESVALLANGEAAKLNESTTMFSFLEENWSLVIFTGLIVLLKPLAAAITIGSGGNGGNFAPSLFTGAYLGFFFSRLLNTTGWVKISEGNFTLVGMAGVLSGVMYCPLSAIFLIAEITNGYGLFIPLMIVSAISFFIVKSHDPYSMEIRKLAKDGEVFTHKKEKNILTTIRLPEMLQEKHASIHIDQSFRDLVDLIKKSDRNIFAVLNAQSKLIGIIELNDIKQLLFQPDQFDSLTIRKLVKKPADIIYENQEMHLVMEKFDITQSWNLPVVDKEKNFIGFISKTKLFDKYREILDSQADLYESTY